MNIPMYSFAGYSNTGKTTFLEKLVAEFKSRGLRVGMLKHDSHGFEIDHEGKDTWRFSQAGADMVAIASDKKFAVIEQRGRDLESALEAFYDVDIVITEGYKFRDYPKLAVYREASGNGLAGSPEEFLAIVTDTKLDTDVPQFPLDDPKPTADFLIEHMRSKEGK